MGVQVECRVNLRLGISPASVKRLRLSVCFGESHSQALSTCVLSLGLGWEGGVVWWVGLTWLCQARLAGLAQPSLA